MSWVGIDPSLTGTAIAVIDDTTGALRTARMPTKGNLADSLDERISRLDSIERWVRDRFEEIGRIDLTIGIEGPAYAAQAQAGVHLRAGLWWRLATRASKYGDLVEISPKQRAKYATGNGNAGKDEVLLAVAKRYPFMGSTNDEADAVVIAAMLARLDGHPIDDPLPKPHLAALDKLRATP